MASIDLILWLNARFLKRLLGVVQYQTNKMMAKIKNWKCSIIQNDYRFRKNLRSKDFRTIFIMRNWYCVSSSFPRDIFLLKYQKHALFPDVLFVDFYENGFSYQQNGYSYQNISVYLYFLYIFSTTRLHEILIDYLV